jgi:hypothetical protein
MNVESILLDHQREQKCMLQLKFNSGKKDGNLERIGLKGGENVNYGLLGCDSL